MKRLFFIVRLDAQEEITGEKCIPDKAKKKQQGEIVSVGPGKEGDSDNRIPSQVKQGDQILFSKYTGKDIKLDNVEYLFLYVTMIFLP